MALTNFFVLIRDYVCVCERERLRRRRIDGETRLHECIILKLNNTIIFDVGIIIYIFHAAVYLVLLLPHIILYINNSMRIARIRRYVVRHKTRYHSRRSHWL